MVDYPVKDIFDTFFTLFDTVLTYLAPFTSFLSTKISELVSNAENLPEWVVSFINEVLELINIGNYSIISIMLGGGLTFYVIGTFLKYFKSFVA